jgi:hypothetical protein
MILKYGTGTFLVSLEPDGSKNILNYPKLRKRTRK